jgi:HEAT repeat protein
MSKQKLSSESREIINTLLVGKAYSERLAALDKLPTLADKDAVADYFVDKLATETDVWRRAWSVSGLAVIGRADTIDTVADHTNPKKEKDMWVRYWATIALAKMQPPDLKTRLEDGAKDTFLVQAVALRLLIENDLDDKAVGELIKMIQQPRSDESWAGCKALRRNSGHKSLPAHAEQRLIPAVVKHLLDEDEWMESRYQAAMALGDVKHCWRESVDALTQALQKQVANDWVRKACLGAMAKIKNDEIKGGLLYALRDSDAEIRVRAAIALKDVLGASDAVRFVVEEILDKDAPPAEYLNALREIDPSVAAETLSSYLVHLDPRISKRASHALATLGGEQALLTLQAQRTKALDTFTDMLARADKDVVPRFKELMAQAKAAFYMSMVMHGIIFAIGILLLAGSAYIALKSGSGDFERYVGVGGAAGSLGVLLTMFYKNPISNIRNSVTGLVKVNVVFLGYVRQMNQIDATFKQLFLAATGFGLDQMKDTVEQIQNSVMQTLEQVKTHLSS